MDARLGRNMHTFRAFSLFIILRGKFNVSYLCFIKLRRSLVEGLLRSPDDSLNREEVTTVRDLDGDGLRLCTIYSKRLIFV